ncbi:MAG TPA: M67 family metallopeptidase [Acidimicrobiales bacterium]|nr:M67 family metallopeptidase [Acidimicrobiales bacterium]
MTADQRDAMVATCIRALPDEGCGLLLGTPDGIVVEVVPSENVAHSARVYEIDSRVLLRAFRRADDDGVQVIGVFHSHTHSDPYPSPTDVAQAPDPAWHYVLVGLRDVATVLKSYRIIEGDISTEEVTISH